MEALVAAQADAVLVERGFPQSDLDGCLGNLSLIDQGPFDQIYKGTMGGMDVAMKRLIPESDQRVTLQRGNLHAEGVTSTSSHRTISRRLL